MCTFRQYTLSILNTWLYTHGTHIYTQNMFQKLKAASHDSNLRSHDCRTVTSTDSSTSGLCTSRTRRCPTTCPTASLLSWPFWINFDQRCFVSVHQCCCLICVPLRKAPFVTTSPQKHCRFPVSRIQTFYRMALRPLHIVRIHAIKDPGSGDVGTSWSRINSPHQKQ